ncbi:MAG: fumarate hydratase [Planctomycetota bacterium]
MLSEKFLKIILKNAQIAKEENIPICQDTGIVCVYLEIGDKVVAKVKEWEEIINKAVGQGYIDFGLRKSVVTDPIERKNTGNNTPVLFTYNFVEGEKVRCVFLAKGTGAENKSALKMLTPAEGVNGIKQFVVETVKNANGEACPPVIIGIGLGGSFDKCAVLAKKALFRPLGQPNPNPIYAKLEQEILEEVNKTGIGPQGFGGTLTALAVHIEYLPCHIGALPCAINLDCHAHRRVEFEI